MNNNAITTSLAARLWTLADTFRGIIPTETTAEILAALFFLKRLSDLATSEQLYQLPILIRPPLNTRLAKFAWQSPERGDAVASLTRLLRAVEADVEDLTGLSSHTRLGNALTTGAVSEDIVRTACEHIGRVDTIPLAAAQVGAHFQEILDSMADSAASSVTPRTVRKLMVRLVRPTAGNTIYDPVCGYTSLLCEAAASAGGRIRRIAGQEINLGTLLLGRMNTILHGLPAQLAGGNTLVDPKHREKSTLSRFDVVLANPPFGVKVSAEELRAHSFGRFDSASPSTSELAFLLHVEASLSANGRGAIIVPQGLLFRAGTHHAVRQQLISEGRIEAVVALPPQMFPGTPIPAAVIVLRGERIAKPSDSILFIDLAPFTEGTKTRHLTDEGISVAEECVTRREARTGVAAIVPAAVIERNDCNLSVYRYVRSAPSENAVTFSEEIELFSQAIHRRNAAEERALEILRGLNASSQTGAIPVANTVTNSPNQER